MGVARERERKKRRREPKIGPLFLALGVKKSWHWVVYSTEVATKSSGPPPFFCQFSAGAVMGAHEGWTAPKFNSKNRQKTGRKKAVGQNFW
jgi:hypothetical protein